MELTDLSNSFYVELNGAIVGRVFLNAAGRWTAVSIVHANQRGIIEGFTTIANRKSPEAAARAFLSKYRQTF